MQAEAVSRGERTATSYRTTVSLMRVSGIQTANDTTGVTVAIVLRLAFLDGLLPLLLGQQSCIDEFPGLGLSLLLSGNRLQAGLLIGFERHHDRFDVHSCSGSFFPDE